MNLIISVELHNCIFRSFVSKHNLLSRLIFDKVLFSEKSVEKGISKYTLAESEPLCDDHTVTVEPCSIHQVVGLHRVCTDAWAHP